MAQPNTVTGTPLAGYTVLVVEDDYFVAHEVCRQLEDWGVDGTVALCWEIDDPEWFPLEKKLAGMEAFARTYLR